MVDCQMMPIEVAFVLLSRLVPVPMVGNSDCKFAAAGVAGKIVEAGMDCKTAVALGSLAAAGNMTAAVGKVVGMGCRI